jgi:hypothetical protein
VEIRLIESIKQSVLVAVKHADEADGGEKSYNWLQSQVKSGKVRSFDNIGVLVAEFKLIK